MAIRFQYPPIAEPLKIAPPPTNDIRWQPSFPDRIWKATTVKCNGESVLPQLTSCSERTSPDKYQPVFPDIIWRAKRGERAPKAFEPQLASWAERSSPDKYHAEFPDFPGRKARSGSQWGQPYCPQLVSWGETIYVDKWKPEQPDFPGRKAPNGAQWGMPFAPILSVWAETIYGDKWQSAYPDRLPRAASGALAGQHFGTLESSYAEIILADKWSPSLVDFPGRKAPNGTQDGQAFAPIETSWLERSTPDKWEPAFPDRLWRAASGAINGQPFSTLESSYAENITADKWGPSLVDFPGRKAPSAAQSGQAFAPDLTAFGETIYADKWKPAHPDFLLRPKRVNDPVSASPVAPVAVAESVSCDKSQPAIAPLKTQRAVPQTSVFAPSITDIRCDSWLPLLALHLRRFSLANPGLAVNPPLATPIGDTRWQPTYAERVWKAQSNALAGQSFSTPITAHETITCDKWASSYPHALRRSQSCAEILWETAGLFVTPKITPTTPASRILNALFPHPTLNAFFTNSFTIAQIR